MPRTSCMRGSRLFRLPSHRAKSKLPLPIAGAPHWIKDSKEFVTPCLPCHADTTSTFWRLARPGDGPSEDETLGHPALDAHGWNSLAIWLSSILESRIADSSIGSNVEETGRM